MKVMSESNNLPKVSVYKREFITELVPPSEANSDRQLRDLMESPDNHDPDNRENGMAQNDVRILTDNHDADNRENGMEVSQNDVRILTEKKQETIFARDVQSVIFNMTVLLEADGQFPVLDKPLNHHRNVATDSKSICHGSVKCSSLDVFKENLRKKISGSPNKLPQESVISILHQVSSGLQHLHHKSGPHGKLSPDHVFLSCDDKHHAVIVEPVIDLCENDRTSAEDDIRCLGKIFYFVLTNGKELVLSETRTSDFECLDKGTTKHLVDKMLTGNVPIEYVLQHPMFWNDRKKICFITDLFDATSTEQLRPACEKLEEEARRRITNRNWIDKLKLDSDDRMEIEDPQIPKEKIYNLAANPSSNRGRVNYIPHTYDKRKEKVVKTHNSMKNSEWKKLRESNKNKPPSNQIQEAIQSHSRDLEYVIKDDLVLIKNEGVGYNGDSFYELLRFFRNRKAHYAEGDRQLKQIFQSYPAGFWKFFCTKFPQFLAFIYDHREELSGRKDVQ